jgi:hypothetical protein
MSIDRTLVSWNGSEALRLPLAQVCLGGMR